MARSGAGTTRVKWAWAACVAGAALAAGCDRPATTALPGTGMDRVELTPAVVSNVIDGNTLQLVGDANGEVDLAGVDAPVGDDCYAAESTSYLASITNQQVLVEEPGNSQEGVYLWFPLQNGSGFRVLVNQAHTFGNGGGFDNGLPFTLTMGCGTWQGNALSDNLNWRCFVNITHLVTTILEDKPSEEALFGPYWQKYGKSGARA